jgi:hypothetical protein
MAAAPPTPAKARSAHARRREQLLRTLERAEGYPYARALDELAVKGIDLAAWNSVKAQLVRLLEEARKKKVAFYLPPFWLDALAKPGKALIPIILKDLRAESTSPEGFHLLLLALGRMGRAANEAMPVLRAKLAAARTPPRTKAQIRVVLANLGDRSMENLAAILTDLRRDSQTRMATLQIMALTNARDWVTDDIINELAERPTPVAALTLGALGKRAASAAKLLAAFQQDHIANRSATQVVYGLALARVDPKQRDVALRRLCKNYFHTSDLGLLILALYPPYVLVDAEISKHLAQLVRDKDSDVTRGALQLLADARLAAREAAPSVLTFVRGTADTKRRAGAARVLARIADYSLLPKLKGAADIEKSAEVRHALQATVKFIELLDPDKAWPD